MLAHEILGSMDGHQRDLVIRVFATRIVELVKQKNTALDEFCALHDAKKKEEKAHRREQQSVSADKRSRSEADKDAQGPDEQGILESIGTMASSSLAKISKKQKRQDALEELSAMQKRVQEILDNCHDLNCDCDECACQSASDDESN
jgi:glycyl-tRNA synthetase beta subunit